MPAAHPPGKARGPSSRPLRAPSACFSDGAQGATPLPPEIPGWVLGVPPLTPARAPSGSGHCLQGGPGRGWSGRAGSAAVSRVSASGPWASVSPRWRPGPSCPVASPSPSPRGCREKREPGPAAKMSPQGVLRLSRLSQAEFHAQPLGTVGARGAFHHLGLGSPLGTVFIWP